MKSHLQITVEEFREKIPCIQSECDGTGCIPNQVAEDEWEAQQCQFHAEYLLPIESFLTERYKDLEEKIEGMKSKIRENSLVSPLESYRIEDQEYGYSIALQDVLKLFRGDTKS